MNLFFNLTSLGFFFNNDLFISLWIKEQSNDQKRSEPHKQIQLNLLMISQVKFELLERILTNFLCY